MFVCVCVCVGAIAGRVAVRRRAESTPPTHCAEHPAPPRRRAEPHMVQCRMQARGLQVCVWGGLARWRQVFSGAWLQLRENVVQGGLGGVTGHAHEKQIEGERGPGKPPQKYGGPYHRCTLP